MSGSWFYVSTPLCTSHTCIFIFHVHVHVYIYTHSKLGEGGNRIIYRHYATLYFVFCVDTSESELGILDLIQVRII